MYIIQPSPANEQYLFVHGMQRQSQHNNDASSNTLEKTFHVYLHNYNVYQRKIKINSYTRISA